MMPVVKRNPGNSKSFLRKELERIVSDEDRLYDALLSLVAGISKWPRTGFWRGRADGGKNVEWLLEMAERAEPTPKQWDGINRDGSGPREADIPF